MKMKKSLLSVVFLLATSSAMAAMSYSSASVTSDMSVNLVDTDDALLALTANANHNAAFYTNNVNANKLKIDLDKGYEGTNFGIQGDSIYSWDELFMVTNNSEHPVNVTIKTDPNENGELNLSARGETGGWVKLSGANNPANGTLQFTLDPNDTEWIDIETNSKNNVTPGEKKFDLIVEGTSVVPTVSTP